MQQSDLGMELHPWRGKGVRLGPVAQAAGGARSGGTTVAAETYNPAWSVADEDQVSEGGLQSSFTQRLGHHGDNRMAQ